MRTLLIVLCLALPVAAQTRADLDSRYGPVEGGFYRVKPGIAVEAIFSDSGNVTQFRIVPDDPKDKNALMRLGEVRDVIQELIPRVRFCRPRDRREIDTACPPRKQCQGFEETFRAMTTLMVEYKKSIAYVLITLKDDLAPPPGNMKLLPGYENVPGCGMDTLAGAIKKAGGIEIHYDIEGLAGNFARLIGRSAVWTRTEQANGDTVFIVLKDENTIYATFDKASANFSAKVGSQSDIDDFLKMILTYDPGKRN